MFDNDAPEIEELLRDRPFNAYLYPKSENAKRLQQAKAILEHYRHADVLPITLRQLTYRMVTLKAIERSGLSFLGLVLW